MNEAEAEELLGDEVNAATGSPDGTFRAITGLAEAVYEKVKYWENLELRIENLPASPWLQEKPIEEGFWEPF